tara:strand:- start:291 stop:584 length:294 start_codon:yes stop_codon:yes gene_type:complete
MTDLINNIMVLYGVLVFVALLAVSVNFMLMHSTVARLLGGIVACAAIMVASTVAFSLFTMVGVYKTLPLEIINGLRFAIFSAGAFIGAYTTYIVRRL